MKDIQIKQEGGRVLLGNRDKMVADMPWDAAIQVAKAIMSQAKKAEEYAKANQIIFDHALLTRVGFPVGLSNNPKIITEVKKEAVSNRDLRRYLPGGVKSGEVFGTPTITQGLPK